MNHPNVPSSKTHHCEICEATDRETFDLGGTWACRACIEDHAIDLAVAGHTEEKILPEIVLALREFARREMWRAHRAYLERFGIAP